MSAAAASKRGITWKNTEGKGSLANVREFESNVLAPHHVSQKTHTKKKIATPNVNKFSYWYPVMKNATKALNTAESIHANAMREGEDPENAAIRIAAERAAGAKKRSSRRRRGGRRSTRRRR